VLFSEKVTYSLPFNNDFDAYNLISLLAISLTKYWNPETNPDNG
jgi:hypothetical protein